VLLLLVSCHSFSLWDDACGGGGGGRLVVQLHLAAGAPVRAPSCWLSNSTSCCSRSIEMMSGTTRTNIVVPAIQAAVPGSKTQATAIKSGQVMEMDDGMIGCGPAFEDDCAA
jgi:hypothetical protein